MGYINKDLVPGYDKESEDGQISKRKPKLSTESQKGAEKINIEPGAYETTE